MEIQLFGADEAVVKLTILDQTIDQAGEKGGHRAAETIARSARLMMPVGPIDRGHVRDTAHAEGMEAIIGGAFFPYTGWLEFGGRVGKIDPITGRFGIYRDRKMPEGRYLYPSYLRHVHDVDEYLDRETTKVIEHAGLEDTSI